MRAWILAGLLLSLPLEAEVLAVVDATPITSRQVQQALSSSLFATQYFTLDPEAQAALRRDLLQRLVQAEVLYQEAKNLGLERDERVLKDVASFETGLLAQKYLQFLRDSIKVPEEEQVEWRRLGFDHDALAAAKALSVASPTGQRRPRLWLDHAGDMAICQKLGCWREGRARRGSRLVSRWLVSTANALFSAC